MFDWFPFVFIGFKVLVLGVGMFFAIKWHHDQGKTTSEMRAVLLASGKVAAVFVLSLAVLAVVTFFVGTKLGLDLTF